MYAIHQPCALSVVSFSSDSRDLVHSVLSAKTITEVSDWFRLSSLKYFEFVLKFESVNIRVSVAQTLDHE